MATVKIEKKKLMEMISSIVQDMDSPEGDEAKPTVEMSKAELKDGHNFT